MTHHHKYQEIMTLVSAGIPVLLTGEKGSGKTTLAKQVAEAIDLPFFSVSMTRQTTLSHLLGFLSVTGDYIPSQLYRCATHGGVFSLDEIDAGDANVLLSLNTIENGYISFPQGVVELHKDFRLLATANPQDQHQHYTGRSKLDAATLDRFDIVDIDRDEELEKSLVGFDTYRRINLLREVLKSANSTIVVSMRDSMRYQKRKDLKLLDGFVYRLTGKNDSVYRQYETKLESMPKHSNQSECVTVPDLFELASIQSKIPKFPPEETSTK